MVTFVRDTRSSSLAGAMMAGLTKFGSHDQTCYFNLLPHISHFIHTSRAYKEQHVEKVVMSLFCLSCEIMSLFCTILGPTCGNASCIFITYSDRVTVHLPESDVQILYRFRTNSNYLTLSECADQVPTLIECHGKMNSEDAGTGLLP